MLAYYVEWHMREAWAPLLFAEDDRQGSAQRRGSPVKPATRSARATQKASSKKTPDGETVHRFRGLLDHLATLTKNTIQPQGDLPAFDRKAQAINHLLIGHAVDCDMDTNGRVLLSQTLRNFAGLDKRIMMVGQADKFELWDEAGWNLRRDELPSGVSQLHEEPSDALRKLVL